MATRTRRAATKVTPLKALQEPFFLRDAGGLIQHGLMVEAATWDKGEIQIVGWAVGVFRVVLFRGGVATPSDVSRVPRSDVAASLGLEQTGEGIRRPTATPIT
ncbi:MAG: hypothetical protein U5L74_02825 [Ideonella sp.]|nr:hypothetical protein [Ideonella sp.]